MSDEEERQRLRTLTEQGEAMYAATQRQHLTNVASTFTKLITEIQSIEANRNDKAVLQQIKTCISTLSAKHDTAVQQYRDYLQRTNTAQSMEDKTQLERDANAQKAQVDIALTQLQELATALQDVASTTSRSSSATTMRAKAEAARTRLEYAKKEVELKKKRAALEADLELLGHEKELAAAEA